MSFPVGCRDVVYTLRAEGLSVREIEHALTERFPGQNTPSDSQVWRWLGDPEAAALVKREETRLRASYVNGAREVVPNLFRGITAALEGGQTQSVRDLSQALAAVTRGIVRDQVEITTTGEDTDHELAALLARNGVSITPEQRVNAVRSSETPSP